MIKNTKKNLIIGYLLQYIILILVIIVCQTALNSFIIKKLENHMLDILSNTIENNVRTVENNVARIKETTSNIAESLYPSLSLVERNDISFNSDINAIKDNLNSLYSSRDTLIKDICIQNDDKDLIVSTKAGFRNRMNFYRTTLQSKEKTPKELIELSETAKGFCSQGIATYNKGTEVLPFCVSAPLLRNRTGSVISYIDIDNLFFPMFNMITDSNGKMIVVDSQENYIINFGNEPDFDYKKYLSKNANEFEKDDENYGFFQIKGENSKWSYNFFVSKDYMLKDVRIYQIILTFFNILMFLIGFAISFIYAKKKSAVYSSFMENLGITNMHIKLANFIKSSEYEEIGEHLSKIKEENVTLLKKGVQNLLRRLLNGQIKEENIESELLNYKMTFSNTMYTVIVIRLNNRSSHFEKFEELDLHIIHKLSQIVSDLKVCSMEKNTIAIILPIDKEEDTDITDKCINLIKYEILYRYDINVIIGISESCETVKELPLLYRQAYEAAEYGFLTETEMVLFYNKIPFSETSYYYPVELETVLLSSVEAGDFKKSREAINRIREENFVKRRLGVSATEELFAELRASVKKILLLQSEDFETFQDKYSINHFFEHFTSVIYTICFNIENHKESLPKGEKRIIEIEKYIQENYNNSGLGINMISQAIDVHPNYLSSLYKKYRGITLVSYIENYRIEKAAELLMKNEYTINEISDMVGFSNTTSFRRSFKKIKGVSPSSYML